MRFLQSHILTGCFCLVMLSLTAQRRHAPAASVPPATVQATTDVQKIYIGQPIRLTFEATVPDKVPFTWPVIDSFPHFERLDSGRIDTTIGPGQRSYRQQMTVTSWDSGLWVIPRMAFMAAGKKAFSDSIRIYVDYSKDPSKDYHDIKDIVEMPNPFARYFGWIVAAITLISLALVVWLVSKRRLLRLWTPEAIVLLSPYEEAMQQLDEVARQHLPETGKMKLHYSRLGEILRQYLTRRLGIASLAETSEELIGEIRRYQLLTPEVNDALAEALRMGDSVKFAKYQPGLADSRAHYDTIRAAIESMEKQETAKEERRRSDGQPENETLIQQTQ